jgi:hypothetical protein
MFTSLSRNERARRYRGLRKVSRVMRALTASGSDIDTLWSQVVLFQAWDALLRVE